MLLSHSVAAITELLKMPAYGHRIREVYGICFPRLIWKTISTSSMRVKKMIIVIMVYDGCGVVTQSDQKPIYVIFLMQNVCKLIHKILIYEKVGIADENDFG